MSDSFMLFLFLGGQEQVEFVKKDQARRLEVLVGVGFALIFVFFFFCLAFSPP